MIYIAALPECWIENIAEGGMSVSEWVEESRPLGRDCLELLDRFPRRMLSGEAWLGVSLAEELRWVVDCTETCLPEAARCGATR